MKSYLLPLLALALTARVSSADDLASGIMPTLVESVPTVAAAPTELDALAAEIASLNAQCPDQFSVFSGDETASEPQADVDLATLYKHAVRAQRLAKLKQHLLALKELRDARQAELVLMEKSLVEREQERVEADTATPEDSPTPIPFSLDRPQSFVSDQADESLDALTDSVEVEHLAPTPEPATWALGGLGAAFLAFRLRRRALTKTSSLSDQIYRTHN